MAISATESTILAGAYLYVGKGGEAREYRWRPAVGWQVREPRRFIPRRWKAGSPPQWVSAHTYIPKECRP